MGSRLSELPEECISKILSFTTAADACKACVLSRGFRSAADLDSTWEKFLPPDYEEMIAASPTSIPHGFKKELYFLLYRWSGKKCYMLGASELNIAWGDNPTFWSWYPIPDSRFAEVAELHFVWRLDINGRIETRILSPATNYAAYLVYKTATNSWGFDSIAVNVWVRPVDEIGHYESANEIEANADRVFLVQRRQGQGHRGGGRWRLLRQREDGWMEAEMGEFYNDGQGNNGNYIEMRCREVGDDDDKSGLIVLGMELRPKARLS
ncbi:Phloem protein 2-like [Dillenia turbinata]|uniref:Phloem protein 2-like n=1 Tax=Dillenia turbinata TaxID=194707 RepID=A0AAN8UCD7_9MAGN